MYPLVLFLHSWLRWLVLVLALWAIVRSAGAVTSRRAWTPSDDAAGRWLVASLDLQLVLGLLLYGLLSPITGQGMASMGEAMRDPILRFWTVEHLAVMIVAIVLAHIGRARTRRLSGDAARHRTALIFYSLALAAMLLSIPWPFVPAGRPLIRLW